MKIKVFEFGPFELDLAQQQLRRRGTRLRLPASRIRLLLLFVLRHGDLITREEIADCLWKDAQNVDVMSGINTAVNQLRTQLGDDPTAPKYIETVIGAGYRFIASVSEVVDTIEVDEPVEPAPQPIEPPLSPMSDEPSLPLAGTLPQFSSTRRRRWLAVALTAAVALCASVSYFVFQREASHRPAIQADLKLDRVTGSGDIQTADISPDGNYVVYVREAAGRQSLWLKQLATGRILQLASIGQDECPGLAFSPDGNYVYFVRKRSVQASGKLYRVPFRALV
jgi:DNA-binding winged helix-turn-helix (wHTH) protein